MVSTGLTEIYLRAEAGRVLFKMRPNVNGTNNVVRGNFGVRPVAVKLAA